jgi:pimeloyl-ACP methyl ester carboxylesterase
VSGPAPFPANLTNPDTQPWTRGQIEAEATDLARRIKENPEALLDEWAASAPESDRERLRQADFRTFITETFREGLHSGTAGDIHDEMLIYIQPWGFSLEDVRAETHVWHGEADSVVPVEQGRYLSEHIPNATLHLLPGAGHLVPAEVWEPIFACFR